MVWQDELIKKLTARNFISVSTAFTLLFSVVYGLTHTTEVLKALENPLVTFILGTFQTVVVMVYVFYYRKNPTPPTS